MGILLKGGPQGSRGFTLIEMSIVLVIIGLIIGGILKGQEIVDSAKEKNLVNQINGVRVGVNTYFDHHGALPGDDPQGAGVGFGIAAGDGNGLIGTEETTIGNISTGVPGFMTTTTSENWGFFEALSSEGLLKDSVPAQSTAAPTNFGAVNQSVLPGISVFPLAGLAVVSAPHPGLSTVDAQSVLQHANWLTTFSFKYASSGGLSPRAAGHIDGMIDDGNAQTGTVRGDNTTCNAGPNTTWSGAASTVAATTNLDNPTCFALFELVAN